MLSWNEDRESILRTLWAEGKSATIIADILDLTRNAVIGKLNQLGLIGVRRADKRDWNDQVVRASPSAPRRFSWED